MSIRDTERAIRDLLREVEGTEGCQVIEVKIVKIDPDGRMPRDVDYCLDVEIVTNRLPGTRWMEN